MLTCSFAAGKYGEKKATFFILPNAFNAFAVDSEPILTYKPDLSLTSFLNFSAPLIPP